MSRFKKIAARVFLPVLCAALLLGSMAVNARAVSTVTARLRPDYTVVIDGAARTFYNAGGQQVHPISCQDTTYLPVRAIGELMGKQVYWYEDTKTVSLKGVRTDPAASGTPDAGAKAADISAEIRDDFTVLVDDKVCAFADASGKTVYPLLYQGTTYLPIRAIGQLMGKTVSWDEATKTATLSGSTVTDADVIVPGGGTAPAPGGQRPGLPAVDEIKAKALAHAGRTAEEVTFTEAKPDWDGGRQVYDVEFYYPAGEVDSADRTDYDYEIDAASGEILEFSQKVRTGHWPASGGAGTIITREKAQEIALAKVPGASADNVTKLKLDRDDGMQIYEVEVVCQGMEYDLEISAADGRILEFDGETTLRAGR